MVTPDTDKVTDYILYQTTSGDYDLEGGGAELDYVLKTPGTTLKLAEQLAEPQKLALEKAAGVGIVFVVVSRVVLYTEQATQSPRIYSLTLHHSAVYPYGPIVHALPHQDILTSKNFTTREPTGLGGIALNQRRPLVC